MFPLDLYRFFILNDLIAVGLLGGRQAKLYRLMALYSSDRHETSNVIDPLHCIVIQAHGVTSGVYLIREEREILTDRLQP